MKLGTRVKLNTFNLSSSPPQEVEVLERENTWKLIGRTGTVVQSPREKGLYSSFSSSPRLLIKFDDDLPAMGLEADNEVENALWIMVEDLKPC